MQKLIMTTAVTLTVATSGLAQTATNTEMRSLTSSVLAGITGKKAAPVAKTEVKTDALKGLVQQALSQGQSDAYLEALIGEAADKGEIEVPEEMRTTDGSVDTRTLLASLIAKSESSTSTATLQGEAQGDVLADVQDQQAERFYKVKAGDSLAAISLIYYDTAQDYGRIFQANRKTLSSPNRIRIGQSLVIPY